MKKSELKKVLKPLIKECIQEALVEEGLLSNVISEVVKGLGTTQQVVVEDTRHKEDEMKKMQLQEKQKRTISPLGINTEEEEHILEVEWVLGECMNMVELQ